MNAHTFQVLEFDRIREILSSLARSPLGAARARIMTPSADLMEIEREMDRVSELSSLLDSGDFRLGPLHDIGDALDMCSSEGAVLEPDDIYRVAQTVKTSREARTYLVREEEKYPLLSELAIELASAQDLEKAIFTSVDETGEVLDSASQELKSIRRRRETLKDSIRRNLETVMGTSQELLQERLITLRQERYVIPIKSESKGMMRCIVHDASASGATLFVEPLEVLDLNNELQENRKREVEEIRRILAELSERVRQNAPDLRQSLGVLSHMDLLHAKVTFAREFKCTRPQMDESGGFRLKGGAHPLLLKKKGQKGVVPLDVELGQGFNTLLISGPNAGGKTVALKTVGVIVLLAQCGMHVPAKHGTRLSVFTGLHADIGDEQSIERDLSTFTSHMSNIVEILEAADTGSLVLLDEIGVGTDPTSGTGIAMAVLSELTRRGARTLATSHYGELKIFVEASARMRNASVEYDPETMRPTYRLKLGIPGSSNTFEIAARLGMDSRLLELAREYASEGSTRAEEIISSLERSLSRSERLASEAGSQKERLDRLVAEYESRLSRIREQEKEARARRREQARRVLESARSTVENLVREIRESQADREAIRNAKRTIEHELEKRAQPENQPSAPREELRVGDSVLVEPFSARGRVVGLTKGSVKVEVQKVRWEVPRSAVAKAPPGPEEPPPSVRTPGTEATFELNLIGTTRDEAIQALDKHIDRAFMSGLSIVRVVHGKGKGILREAIREALERDARVESHREGSREEGGWGVTVVKLKT